MNYLSLLTNFFRLRGNTKKTTVQLLEIQEKKLRGLLHYAYEHSAYHRRQFQEAGIDETMLAKLPLSRFPTMDKPLLMENFDDIITTRNFTQEDLRAFDRSEAEQKSKFLDRYHIVHSSGSTGKPMYFVYDEAAWNQMLMGIIRGALWDMSAREILDLLLVKGPRIVYIAATDGRYGGAMAVGSGIDGLNGKQLSLDINRPLSEWVERIQAFNPNFIIGYPSAIKILGELVEKGEVSVNVLRVVSCGEPLAPCLRNYLEKVFQAEIINFYGASESLALGVESSRTDGMCLFDDLNIIEVEDGNMYLTCLYNKVQPLIRYRITDQLVVRPPDLLGETPFSKADILLGRDEDILWFEDVDGNRDFLHPLAIEGFCLVGLLDYQFMQTNSTAFVMLAEISDKAREEAIRSEMKTQMRSILSEKKMDYVSFDVRFVNSILPDSRTGKKPLIVKNPEGGAITL